MTSGEGAASTEGYTPPGDIHRPPRLCQHRRREPTSEGPNKANPFPTPCCSSYPIGTGHITHGVPPSFALSCRGLTGPQCSEQPPGGPRKPQPGRRHRAPRALRPSDLYQQKLSSSTVVLHKRFTQTWSRGQTRPNSTRHHQQIAKPIHAQEPLA